MFEIATDPAQRDGKDLGRPVQLHHGKAHQLCRAVEERLKERTNGVHETAMKKYIAGRHTEKIQIDTKTKRNQEIAFR